MTGAGGLGSGCRTRLHRDRLPVRIHQDLLQDPAIHVGRHRHLEEVQDGGRQVNDAGPGKRATRTDRGSPGHENAVIAVRARLAAEELQVLRPVWIDLLDQLGARRLELILKAQL